MDWRKIYTDAYRAYQDTAAPQMVKDHGYVLTSYPKVNTANGLTQMVVKFLTWKGHRATRVNSTGRLVNGSEKQASGVVLGVKKWIKGTTRKGAADVSSTIKGRSVMWEIKIGADRASEFQLREQELERKAGGEYFFIKTPEQFFDYYFSLTDSHNLFT